nr:unnamed protein product [Callosobruchus analis]
MHCNATFKNGTKKKNCERKLPVVYSETERNSYVCYYGSYITSCKKNLIDHISVGDCSLEMELGNSVVHTSQSFICMYCLRTFNRKIDLEKHITRMHSASVSSEKLECKSYQYKTVLRDNFKPHYCKACIKAFKRRFQLNEHILKEHPMLKASISSKIHKCTFCDYRSTNKTIFNLHMASHPGGTDHNKLYDTTIKRNINICLRCNNLFGNKKLLGEHIIDNHPNFIAYIPCKIQECVYCTFKSTFPFKFAKHMLKHEFTDLAARTKKGGKGPQVGGQEAERALFICYNCNFTASTKTRLLQHIGVGNCIFKANSAKSRPVYTRQNPSNDYVCTQCGIMFTRKPNLDEHIIKKHIESIESVSSKIHRCTRCDYKTTRKCRFNRHILAHITVDNAAKKKKGGKEPQVDGMEPQRALFICYICNDTFSTKTALIQHVGLGNCKSKADSAELQPAYTRQKPSNDYVCTKCNAVFTRKLNLDEHILRKHRESLGSVSSKIHGCTLCDYKTTRKYYLSSHMSTHPTADDICDYQSAKKYYVDKHIMLKHVDADSSSNIINCKHCDSRYKSEQGLINHIIKEHPDFIGSVTRKIYECSYCPFKTAYKICFDGHMTSHSDLDSKLAAKKKKGGKEPQVDGTEPERALFICYICNDTFSTKTELIQHVGVKKCKSKANSAESRPAGTRQNPQKDYACVKCNSVFTRKLNLDEHILRKHRESIGSVSSKIHVCTLCDYKTTRKYFLQSHMLTHPAAVDIAAKKKKRGKEPQVDRMEPERVLLICYICNYVSSTKAELIQHIAVRNCNLTTKSRPAYTRQNSSKNYVCTQCNIAFRMKRDLDGHIIKLHRESIESVSSKFMNVQIVIIRLLGSIISTVIC